MKYEKYLFQLAKMAVNNGYFMNFHANCAKHCNEPSIFKQIFMIESSLAHIIWDGKNFEKYKIMLTIPRKYVEKSDKTTAMAIYNAWMKEENTDE